MALPSNNESQNEIIEACKDAVKSIDGAPVICGFSEQASAIIKNSRELIAMDTVQQQPELAGDDIARRGGPDTEYLNTKFI